MKRPSRTANACARGVVASTVWIVAAVTIRSALPPAAAASAGAVAEAASPARTLERRMRARFVERRRPPADAAPALAAAAGGNADLIVTASTVWIVAAVTIHTVDATTPRAQA